MDLRGFAAGFAGDVAHVPVVGEVDCLAAHGDVAQQAEGGGGAVVVERLHHVVGDEGRGPAGLAEARIAEKIGLAEPGLAKEITTVLHAVGLPTEISLELDRAEIIAAMTRDKKKAGGIVRFALPAAIGEIRVGVEVEDWQSMIDNL